MAVTFEGHAEAFLVRPDSSLLVLSSLCSSLQAAGRRSIPSSSSCQITLLLCPLLLFLPLSHGGCAGGSRIL
jgi:hypothetical protein